MPNNLIGSASTDKYKLQNLDYLYEEDKKNIDSFSIKTKTLDVYSSDNNKKKVDFIKIDVEGHEENVLLGSKNIIESSRELIVLMEWNIGFYSDKLLSCLDLFDYIYHLSNDGTLNDIKKNFSNIKNLEKFVINEMNIKDTIFECLLSKRKLLYC